MNKVRDHFQAYSYGRLTEMDDAADIEYWMSKSDAEKFDEAWRLVVQACKLKGMGADELRLRRSIGSLQPIQC